MLSDKVAQLRQGATIALTTAEWWESMILTHGEAKAEAFYTQKLGLNHLRKSSVEWEGLTLSREPNDIEKLCIKSIAQAQESGKESVKTVLLQIRSSLIDSALSAIKKLTPATYHELVLTVPAKLAKILRDELGQVFMKGKRLVDSELAKQTAKSYSQWEANYKQSDPTEDDDSELDNYADLTNGRMANEIQARITAAAARFTLLGLTGKTLWDAVSKEVGDGSMGWLDRIATGISNKVLNFGRSREAEDRKDEWDRVEYSALLDSNVCDPCAADDGETASSEGDLTPTPNPDCAGGDWCRCFHVFINQ